MPRKCIFCWYEHSYNFYPAPIVNLGIDREGTAKSQDGQQKGTLAHVKRKVATALSMKVKPVKKYRHSCAFAPISAVEACLENSPSSLHFLFCYNFYSLEAASKPALKPAARLILKDCLFCSKFAWSRTGVATEDANAFSRLAESALFCANFAVAPAGLICLICAILLAVTVWKLTAFSADFGGRCGIYGVCDTEPTEGERLVRQLWHYMPFTLEKTSKTGPACSV